MLKKILSIKSVGKFFNYSCCGDVELRRLNIIYADNGRGKTTLATILRSAKSGAGSLIEGRRTLGASDAPRVQLLLGNNDRVLFENGKWDTVLPDLGVFDETFIAENVYSGSCVDHSHKRNLHRFVIGAQGVKLARKIDELDEDNRAKAGEIRDKENEIREYIFESLEVSDFVELSPLPQGAIAEKEQEIRSLETTEEIAEKNTLSPITLPSIPWTEIEKLLAESITSVSKDAEQQVQEHIAHCMDENGETWIESGLDYIKGERCPFCGQSLADTELVSAYRVYFDKAYQHLKKEVEELSSRLRQILSEDALLAVQGKIASNNELIEFWDDYVQTQFPEIEFEAIQKVWQSVRKALEGSLSQKAAAPLERIEPSDAWEDAIEAYNSISEKVEKYNGILDKANVLVEAKKTEAETGDLLQARKELVILRNQQQRHKPEVAKLCEEYKKLLEEKKALEKRKQETRNALDEYAGQIIEDYGLSINEHLCKCGAGFKIAELETSYMGGKPRTEYCLQIDSERVDLGSADTPMGEPCFKNTLSSGDKSALAFSLFIARLKQYPESDLRDRIIVFDDPASSLDAQRRAYTRHQIIWFAEHCKQVIVLTHNLHLARDIWDNAKHLEPKTLQVIRKKGNYSVIEELDIVEKTKGEYFKSYDTLSRYLEKGPEDDAHLRSVVLSIRPLLEGYLRTRFPREFEAKEWLGDFIRKIREAGKDDSLYSLRPQLLDELSDINSYSKKYHHDQNPNAELEKIVDAELRTYVKRTLVLIG